MEATPPPLGVAAATPSPAWPEAAQWVQPPKERHVALAPAPPGWPRPAQRATGALLLLALGLLGWYVYGSQGWGARPTTLEPDAVLSYRVDLNRADRAQLMQLPGVGESLAGRIVEYRDKNNGFRRIEELRQVRGIGPALLERLRPVVCVEPYEGEEDAGPRLAAAVPPARKEAKVSGGAKKAGLLAGPIDVNRAGADELKRLPGIGPKMAERIIETRNKQPFRSVGELRRVPGIGPKRLEQLRPHVIVGEVSEPAPREG
jgi:competence protein ComEA